MYSTEAEAWQNSLHQFIDLTDRNITILQSERDGGNDKKASVQSQQQPRRASMSGAIPSYQRPRSSSIIRAGNNQTSGESDGVSNNQEPFRRASIILPASMAEKENMLYANSQNPSDISRQCQHIIKKNQFLQEKLKRVEDINSELVKNLNSSNANIEKLIEQQKQDKQLMLTMKDQFVAMKQQVDILNSKQAVMDQSKAKNKSNEINEDSIYERVLQKLQHEVKRSLSDCHEKIENEKNEFMKDLNENSMTECRKFFQASHINSNSIREMEKEILRLRSDTNGMKTKQGYLDTMYNELRDGIMIREKEIEDMHRKAISSYKLDMNSVVESVSRRVNDALNGMHTSLKLAEIPALWKRVEELSQSIKQQSLSGRVDALEEKYNETDFKLRYIASAEFIQDIFDGNVPPFERKYQLGAPIQVSANIKSNAFNMWKSRVESKIEAIEVSTEKQKESNIKFAQSSSQALQDCERKISDALCQIDVLSDTTDKYVIDLVEYHKISNKKIVEMSGTLNGLVTNKQALDEMIIYFDNKMKGTNDAESVNSAIDNSNSEIVLSIKGRLELLESQIQSLKGDLTVSNSVSNSEKSNKSTDDSSMDAVPKELKEFLNDEIMKISGKLIITEGNTQKHSERLMKLEAISQSLQKEYYNLFDFAVKHDDEIGALFYRWDSHIGRRLGSPSSSNRNSPQRYEPNSTFQQPATEAITVSRKNQDPGALKREGVAFRDDSDAFAGINGVGGFSAMDALDELYSSIGIDTRRDGTLFLASDILNDTKNTKDQPINSPSTKSYHTIKPTSSILHNDKIDFKSTVHKKPETLNVSSSTIDPSRFASPPSPSHTLSSILASPLYLASFEEGSRRVERDFIDDFKNISHLMSEKSKFRTRYSKDI